MSLVLIPLSWNEFLILHISFSPTVSTLAEKVSTADHLELQTLAYPLPPFFIKSIVHILKVYFLQTAYSQLFQFCS